jgi:hypothetical protein
MGKKFIYGLVPALLCSARALAADPVLIDFKETFDPLPMIGGFEFVGIQWPQPDAALATNTIWVDYDASLGSTICVKLMTADAKLQGLATFSVAGIGSRALAVVLPFTPNARQYLSSTTATTVGVEVTYVARCDTASAKPRHFAAARFGAGTDRSKLLFLTRALDDLPGIQFKNTTLVGTCKPLGAPLRVGLDTVCELAKPPSGLLDGQITLTDGSGLPDSPLDFSVGVP